MPVSIDQGILNKQAYATSTDINGITSADTETAYLLFNNPSGSGKRVLIHHINFGVDCNTTKCKMRIYANPTVTDNGTSLAKDNTYIGASPPSSNMGSYKNPTVSANGDRIDTMIIHAGSGSRGVNRKIFIDAGCSVLFTIENNAAAIGTFVQLFYLEDV